MDIVELLIGIAEIATALAGFTGVVVAFGSRNQGTWLPGDRLRLAFLLEASLTAAGFALLSLLAFSWLQDDAMTWSLMSGLWVLFTAGSLWNSRRQIRTDTVQRDKIANAITTFLFALLLLLNIGNVLLWHQLPVFLAAIMLNLAGAAMQFARLIRSAFRQ